VKETTARRLMNLVGAIGRRVRNKRMEQAVGQGRNGSKRNVKDGEGDNGEEVDEFSGSHWKESQE
jgi:hypothetical protein